MGRSHAEFGIGHDSARPDIAPGVQTDYWANKRYAGRSEIPFQGPRRAGPLPYPETATEHADAEAERNWSRSQ